MDTFPKHPALFSWYIHVWIKTLKSDFKHNPAISVAHATFPRPLLNVTNATSQSTSYYGYWPCGIRSDRNDISKGNRRPLANQLAIYSKSNSIFTPISLGPTQASALLLHICAACTTTHPSNAAVTARLGVDKQWFSKMLCENYVCLAYSK